MAKEKQENDLETGIKADGSIDVAIEQNGKNLVLKDIISYKKKVY